MNRALPVMSFPSTERSAFGESVYSGDENKVTANLERKIHSLGMEDEIFQVLVPMQNEIEVKDDKKRVIARKVFPGYVLVEMIVNDRSWYAVRNTPGVTGFIGIDPGSSFPAYCLCGSQSILKGDFGNLYSFGRFL